MAQLALSDLAAKLLMMTQNGGRGVLLPMDFGLFLEHSGTKNIKIQAKVATFRTNNSLHQAKRL